MTHNDGVLDEGGCVTIGVFPLWIEYHMLIAMTDLLIKRRMDGYGKAVKVAEWLRAKWPRESTCNSHHHDIYG